MGHTPTRGNCFEDAFKIFQEGLYEVPGVECVLVHGHPQLTGSDHGYPAGTLYGHAWIERAQIVIDHDGNEVDRFWMVIDVFSGQAHPKPIYYGIGRVEEKHVRRYTKEKALKTAIQHNNYGPWHKDPEGSVGLDNTMEE